MEAIKEAKTRKKLADAVVERKSHRVPEVAKRHNFSPAFIYKEIAAGRLKARKAAGATIITIEDETAWLDAMPSVSAA
jgi:hypothetical protein